MIFKGYLFSILYALLCLGLSFAIYKFGAPKKITRKIVHILVGFEWVILNYYMGPSVHFLAVCLLFLLILAVAYRKNLMPMISSDGDNAPGTVYYAVAMSIMGILTLTIPDMILPFGIGVFCTSFGDGFAGLFGQLIKRRNPKIYGNKTIFGTFCNFTVSFLIVGAFNLYFDLGMSVWHFLAIALLCTELELFTGKGLDNISITLGTSLLAYFFINYDSAVNYVVPILLTPAVIAFALKKKALTVDGIIAAIVLDIVISLSLGNFGFTLLLAFFGLGIVADKIKRRYKKSRQNIEKRGDYRNYIQVLSNGLMPAICALIYAFTSNRIFIVAFAASLAEALADTVASGIGAISGKAYDICRFKPCAPGISGGVSFIGTLSSFVGSLIIAMLTLAFGEANLAEAILITACGFLGAIFDSIMGSLIQVKYKCSVCNSITETTEHCGNTTVKHSGIAFVNNDFVNLMGTISSAVLAIVFLYISI